LRFAVWIGFFPVGANPAQRDFDLDLDLECEGRPSGGGKETDPNRKPHGLGQFHAVTYQTKGTNMDKDLFELAEMPEDLDEDLFELADPIPCLACALDDDP
jgi:hypothetical protein